jgi:hypothetical protein
MPLDWRRWRPSCCCCSVLFCCADSLTIRRPFWNASVHVYYIRCLINGFGCKYFNYKDENYLRWSDRVNFFWQTEQVNRFSPVCVLIWRANSSDLANFLSHSGQVHPNGRSP